MKARSYRSVLAVGFRHYTERFRKFFKASWITALVLAVLYGIMGALALIRFPDTLLALLLLAVMPLVLPCLYAVIRRLLRLHRDYWTAPRGNFKVRLRHCGLILLVLFTSALVVLLASSIILIPAGILCLANLSALQGMLMGDPSGMPSYLTGMTFFTFVLTAFMQFYVSQVMLVHHYFACGSIDAKEEDRKKHQMNIE